MTRTYNTITADHRAVYLKTLASTGSHPAACRAIGFSRSAVAAHRKANAEFEQAALDAMHQFADFLLAACIQRGVHGVTQEKGIYHDGECIGVERTTKYSDRLLALALEKIGPEAFRAPERVEHVHHHAGHIAVEHRGLDIETFRRMSPQAQLELKTAAIVADVTRGAYENDAAIIDDIARLSLEAEHMGLPFDGVALARECTALLSPPAIDATFEEIVDEPELTEDQLKQLVPV